MATTKVDKRAEQPPQALRDEFKFMIPQDGKTLKDRVADYVKDGELTKGDEVTLMNWLDNYKEAMAKAPESTGDDKKFAIDEYFEHEMCVGPLLPCLLENGTLMQHSHVHMDQSS